ncbi:MAG TPA: SIS domain-containing protein [bacterium]|nr:SIS domain-containing protein [bacterium]HOZ20872.1 SIS domain-containing protein [bacterium]
MVLAEYQDGYTYQEIIRQQDIWRSARPHLDRFASSASGWVDDHREYLWVFSGCGTSYYLAQTAAALFELITGFRTRAVPSSEILINPQLVFNPHERNLLVAISRSGTTSETLLAAQKAAGELQVPVVSVSCDSQSPLARAGVLTPEFPFPAEQSVVMTGSFTMMLYALVHLALQSRPQSGLLELFDQVPQASRRVMLEHEAAVAAAAERATELESDFCFLGQGPFFGLANEAALKIKEMAISTSISFHALEYRHGPMSVVRDDTVICILLSQAGAGYELQLARDMKNLGARVLLFHGDSAVEANGAVGFRMPGKFGDLFNAFMYMPLLQLYGYYHARFKGINPDAPKNLSAVVMLDY